MVVPGPCPGSTFTSSGNVRIFSDKAVTRLQASPACFDDINPDLLALADYVVRSRRDEKAPARPSSVVKLGADGTVKILRE